MVVAVTIMGLHISVYSSSISFLSLLVVATFVIIATVILYSNSPAFGQTNTGNGTQLWVDRENNVKVQFTYLPQTPIIDTPTQLKFNIQNSQTGTPLRNLVARVVIVTNSGGQERSFKFTNITAPNGSFSVNYLFPDTGVYQVISRIYSKDASILASFKVPVPIQPFGVINTNNINPLILPAGLVGIAGAIAVISFLIMIRKRKEIKKV
ncbi:MAG TPA: hypothetical protein VFI70_03905 [Nitrososphaeraceae archaeon]|nr:hypothetical protein [Nitrososphaeraceae archaeon]